VKYQIHQILVLVQVVQQWVLTDNVNVQMDRSMLQEVVQDQQLIPVQLVKPIQHQILAHVQALQHLVLAILVNVQITILLHIQQLVVVLLLLKVQLL
jgi:beta-glucosidase/6-phospho-beta-glucosidase/beta-galactosidase